MSYPSDLTLEQFALIEHLFPVKKVTKPPTHTRFELFNAILYALVSGCQWRMLPNDLPKWKTVHHYFLTWSEDEVFDEMLKKSLKTSDYNKAKRNIQLYSLQTHKVPKIQTFKQKVIQDLMEVKRSKESKKASQ
jgi:transposase